MNFGDKLFRADSWLLCSWARHPPFPWFPHLLLHVARRIKFILIRHLWQKSSEQNQLNICEFLWQYLKFLTQGTQKSSKEDSQQFPQGCENFNSMSSAHVGPPFPVLIQRQMLFTRPCPVTRTISHRFSCEQNAQDFLLEGGGERKGLTHAEKEKRRTGLGSWQMMRCPSIIIIYKPNIHLTLPFVWHPSRNQLRQISFF